MYCTKCYHTIPDDSKFCTYCGTSMAPVVAVVSPSPAPTPTMAQPAVELATNKSPLSGTTSPETANRAPDQAQNVKTTNTSQRAAWVFVLAGGIIAAWRLITLAFMASETTTQRASEAALAIGIVVIPYCIARAIDEMSNR
jgi:zinc-ribbon domain